MRLHHKPLFIFTIAYILGIVGAVSCRISPLTLLGAGCALLLIGSIAARKPYRLIVILAITVFTVGLVRTSVYRLVPFDDVSQLAEGKLVYLTGRISSDPETRGNRISFILQASEIKTYTTKRRIEGRVMVSIYPVRGTQSTNNLPSYGESVRIHGRLQAPGPPSNPGAIDYREYLARQRIFCTITANSAEIESIKPAAGSIQRAASAFRSAVTTKALYLLPADHARLLIGILLGNYAALPIALQESFMRTGTMHLLAASGFNCGVIALIFGWILTRLTIPKTWRYLILIALLWGFALVAGAGPSIIRASVMMSIFLAAYLLKRAPDLLNIALFACLIILAVNPLSLYDVGFQLSFAAVMTILILMPPADKWISSRLKPKKGTPSNQIRKILLWSARHLSLAVAVSIVAMLGTWPITAYYFNYISIISIIANSLTALVVILLTAGGIITLTLGWLPFSVSHVIALSASLPAWLMLKIVTGLGDITWAAISVRSPSTLFILAYYLILFMVMDHVATKNSHKQTMADTH